jgi:hypothetical protein
MSRSYLVLLFIIVLLSNLAIIQESSAQESIVYSELFNGCAVGEANEQTGWKAMVAGYPVASKLSGANVSLSYTTEDNNRSSEIPVYSFPRGSVPGRIKWSTSAINGELTIFTEEISKLGLDIQQLSRIEFDQRWDSRDDSLVAPFTRIAIRVEGKWYISESTYARPAVITSNTWQNNVNVVLSDTKFIEVPVIESLGILVGPSIINIVGKSLSLPANGKVKAIGLLLNTHARLDIDNFAVFSDKKTLLKEKVAIPPSTCSVDVTISSQGENYPYQFCDYSVNGVTKPAKITFNKKRVKSILKSNRGVTPRELMIKLLVALINNEKVSSTKLLTSLSRNSVVVDGNNVSLTTGLRKLRLSKKTANILRLYFEKTLTASIDSPLIANIPLGEEFSVITGQSGLCPNELALLK